MRQYFGFLVLFGTACTSFHAQTASPAAVVSPAKPRNVELRLRDGTKVTLYDALVVRDSIVGNAAPKRAGPSQRGAFALTDVAAVALEKIDPVPTVVTVGVIIGAVVALVKIPLSAGSYGFNFPTH